MRSIACVHARVYVMVIALTIAISRWSKPYRLRQRLDFGAVIDSQSGHSVEPEVDCPYLGWDGTRLLEVEQEGLQDGGIRVDGLAAVAGNLKGFDSGLRSRPRCGGQVDCSLLR